MKYLFFMALMAITFSSPAFAQSAKKGKVKIKTSAQCGMCQVAIENALLDFEGVYDARLDLTTKVVKVKFDREKTNVNQLRQLIASVGYDADQVPAIPSAYEALPLCCKKESSCSDDKEGDDGKHHKHEEEHHHHDHDHDHGHHDHH